MSGARPAGGAAAGAPPQAAAAAPAPQAAAGAAPAADQQLQADAFKRLYPEQFFARFVAEGVRPDGRRLADARPVSIGLRAVGGGPGAGAGAAAGSALVRVGATSVLAGARLEVAVPPDDAPDRGQVVVTAELTPLCSGDWRPGRPAPPEASRLAARVSEALLSEGGALDARQLVISPGAAIWVIYLDLYVLDASGGLLDAALTAAVAALSDCRLPAVHLTEEGNVERGAGPDGDSSGGGRGGGGEGGRPLALSCVPVCLTCGVYKGSVVVDPDNEEEALMGARLSVISDGAGGLLGVFKPGGAAGVPASTLLKCIALAHERQRGVAALLGAALEAQRAADGEGAG